MKTKRLFLGLIPIALIIIAQSCCKAKEPLLGVQVIDVNGNDLLINATPSDSTWAIIENPDDTIGEGLAISSHDGENSLLFPLYSIESGQNFFLRIDATDVDTVNIDFELKGRCDKRIIIDQIQYNGQFFDCNGGAICTVVK